MKKIVIVDDERDICLLLEKFLSKNGFDTTSFQDGNSAVEWIKSNDVDLVLCDFKLPDYNGLEILQKIKLLKPAAQVIIITGYSEVRIAVEALKKGAYEYVTKPLYPDEILATVKSALESPAKQPGRVVDKSNDKGKSAPKKSPKAFLAGPSKQSQIVVKHIELIAPTDMSVIILGETGTGKEYVAREIHNRSKRSKHPFVAIDRGALPKDLAGSELFGHVKGAFTGAVQDKKGSFELAHKGTLFLDELGNLSYENQIKLLRVLQDRRIKPVGGVKEIEVDVRLLVATNENLRESVQKGEFREDIYHRLNEFKIELSPIRERPDDIEAFAAQFVKESAMQLEKDVEGFTDESIQILKSHAWHGNLRELKNVVKRAVLFTQGSLVESDALPQEIRNPDSLAGHSSVSLNGSLPTRLRDVVAEAERIAIVTMLERTNHNKTETAKLLDIDRKTLYNKLKTYHIDTE